MVVLADLVGGGSSWPGGRWVVLAGMVGGGTSWHGGWWF